MPLSSESNQTVSEMVIRNADESEYEEVIALTLKAYAEFESGAPDGFWSNYTKNIATAIKAHDENERIVLTIDGKLVGCVLLCKKSFRGSDPEIRLLAVDPAYRKKGIAKRLMEECERRVQQRGHTKVILHTTILMKTARGMYERSGYKRYEQEDFSPVPSFTVWGYIKDLL